jgi:2-(1,2-epoxy-1,2-dihydrophenyl)acetyl-CoA isomerase
MVDQEVSIDRQGGVAVLTLNRPARLNALTLNMLYSALPAAIDELSTDEAVRAVVITGAGRGFCAGADLDSGAFDVRDELVEDMRRSHATPLKIYGLGKPTFAAVNGPAAGAGFGIAMACDIRLAAPAAIFVASFIHLGLVPDFGLTWSLPRAIGSAEALRLLLTGESVSAAEALRLGLVSSVHDDVVAAATAMAARLIASPGASKLIKASLRQAERTSLEDTLLNIEPAAQLAAMKSDDFKGLFEAHRQRVRARG